jgi:hypothetical protein
MKNCIFEIIVYLKNKFNYFAPNSGFIIGQRRRKYYKWNLASCVDKEVALNYKLIIEHRIICSPKNAVAEQHSLGNSHYIQAD